MDAVGGDLLSNDGIYSPMMGFTPRGRGFTLGDEDLLYKDGDLLSFYWLF